jgi:hypothetical protein
MAFSKSKIYDREHLKSFFKNGTIPNEKHFSFLIDSLINKQDDGFSKDAENGLILSSSGISKKLITFFKSVDDLEPFFNIEVDDKGSYSFKLKPNILGLSEEEEDKKSFFFDEDGSLGIGKRREAGMKLDIEGFASMEGRTGNFRAGFVPANGKWHSVVKGLNNCHAFELIARTGKKTSGRFAILHANALSTFGHSNNKIKYTSAYYGFFWNKLCIRWKSFGTYNYDLQIKTYRNYGDETQIYFRITNLWDDEMMLPEEYYY